MICYSKNHVFLGFKDKIFYFDIQGILQKYNSDHYCGKRVHETIRADKIRVFKMDNSYAFKGFIEAGTNKKGEGDIILIVEHQRDFVLTFLKIAKVSTEQTVNI